MGKATTEGTLYMASGLVYDNTVAPTDLSIPRHLRTISGSVPTTSNLGANVTSATPNAIGSDFSGSVVVVMAGALAANTRIFTLTFATPTPGPNLPQVRFTNETSGVGLTIVNFYASGGAVSSVDVAANQALAAGTYRVGYLMTG